MGILTLLRNAFGRSRKSRATEAEGADRLPTQPSTPEPRTTEPAPPADETPIPEITLAEPRTGDTPSPEPTVPTECPAPTAAVPQQSAEPRIPEVAEIPEPRQAAPDEHDLVTAAFDSVRVPHPTDPNRLAEPEAAPAAKPEAEAEAAPEAESAPEAEAAPEAQTAPEAETATKPESAPEAETAPEAEAEAAPEAQTAPAAETATKPETAPEAETAAAAEADAETEDQAAAEAEVPTAEAEAEAATAAEGEAAPEAQTAPEATTTADTSPEAPATGEKPGEPEGEAAPKAEEQAETAAEPEETSVEETTEPAAADGEEAPQGPPAPDHETGTGGAGGNPDAEGEAGAKAQPAAEPDAVEETTEPADAEGKTEAKAESAPIGATDDNPKPATPLTKVKSRTPSLATAYKAATATLKKTDLTGTRAKLYLVLDRSASMRPYYKDGSAQALADQALALAAHLDPQATVHVVFFSTEVDGTTDLILAPDHETKIDDVHAGLGRMGRTSYHAAVEAVLDHRQKNDGAGAPTLVIFQTDGAPDAKTPATQSLTEAAKNHPEVFFSFVAFGEHDNKAFDYLRRLKTGNTSFFHAGPTPRELTDTELYEGVLAVWRP
ncbi:hypothetical protein GCM10010503_33960 [Streptomyces lucensis JCM 4490]|uniref:VWFA domain-containing protein n=1 Tax=Streptomyces lucensis JCM 4490 TaxID=1306176 RepID=A0A918MSZ0_9ACTN|nr:VWA domain-containing protein [Streptomyces lucensis]GGW53933.1 hypothetical protein GCM10010503_33960 [Streptomyces lucensis JCM 4490]